MNIKVTLAAALAAGVALAYAKPMEKENLETEVWQAAIDAAHAKGGGRVSVPKGKHVVGQLVLKSNVELHLEDGAILWASGDGKLFREIMRLPNLEGCSCGVVSAANATNVAVTGRGEIFGNGWAYDGALGGKDRGPMGLAFANCRNVRLEDFTLRDAASWGINVVRSEDIIIRRVKVNNHAEICTDGIDIEAKNVLIEDCDVDAGDDAYCVKCNGHEYVVENIVVRNCSARSHCNAFKLGTASHGIMRNVTFEHCRAAASRRVFRDLAPMPKNLLEWKPIKGAPWYLCGPGFGAINVECVDGGLVENVVVDDIEIEGFMCPIFIRGGDRKKRAVAPQGTWHTLRNVVISNVRGRADGYYTSTITGTDRCRPYNIVLKNIDIECVGEGKVDKPYTWPGEDKAGAYPQPNMFDGYHLPAYGLFVDKTDGLVLQNVNFTLRKGTTDVRPAIYK